MQRSYLYSLPEMSDCSNSSSSHADISAHRKQEFSQFVAADVVAEWMLNLTMEPV